MFVPGLKKLVIRMNLAYRSFYDALKRDGKIVYSYDNNTPYDVIFKRNSDTNSFEDKITIFYPTDCGICAGQLLTYKDKHFLTMNQETPENDVYKKSDLIETNAYLYMIENGKEINIPIYAYDIADALLENNNVLSMVSGNIHIITEHNLITDLLDIGMDFDAVGRHWKIDNIIDKDNILHLYCEIGEISAHAYTIDTITDDTYHVGENVRLTTITKMDDVEINSTSIKWESSDTSLISIDNNGIAHFLAKGTANITATWIGQKIYCTASVQITPPVNLSLSVDGNNTYITSDTPTLTASAAENDVIDNSATITWTSSDIGIATIDSTGLVAFLTSGEVTFTALWLEHDITAIKTVTVTEATNITCTITYSGNPEVKAGASKTFIAHFWHGSTELTDQTEEWSLIKPAGYEDKATEEEDAAANTITITISSEDMDIIGEHIFLTLQDSNHTCSTTVDIKVVPLF